MEIPVETERHDVVGVRHDEKRLLVFKIGARHVTELCATAIILLQQIVWNTVMGKLVIGDTGGETLPEDAVAEDDDGKRRKCERPMDVARFGESEHGGGHRQTEDEKYTREGGVFGTRSEQRKDDEHGTGGYGGNGETEKVWLVIFRWLNVLRLVFREKEQWKKSGVGDGGQ